MSRKRHLRAIDLARSVGLSVQQVRNYVDLGILPPVERTESGYRIFTPRHAAAILVARHLIEGHGWQRARTIMDAVNAGDVPTALASVDEGHAELDRERRQIAQVLGALEHVVTEEPVIRKALRIGEVADVLGVRTSALRFWERLGLLRPDRERGTGYRVYSEAELRRAQVVALLRKGGYPFPIVQAVVDELRAGGDPVRVRAELAARERDLVRRSRLRLAASAALSDYLAEWVTADPPS